MYNPTAIKNMSMANDPRYTPYKASNWITPSAMDPNSFGKRMSLRQKRARRAMRQSLACSSNTKTMTKKQKKMRRSYRKMKSYMKNC